MFTRELSAEEETVATIDVRTAFRQSTNFGSHEVDRCVAYKAHECADLRVFKLLGSLHGSKDAAMRWCNTLAPALVGMGFQRGENDECVFYDPKTQLRLATYVDDIIVRGRKKHMREVFKKLADKFEVEPPTH